MFPSYKNQSTDLQSKPIDGLLYDGNIGNNGLISIKSHLFITIVVFLVEVVSRMLPPGLIWYKKNLQKIPVSEPHFNKSADL